MMGLTPGSYEAFCFDQALWYLGTSIQTELEKVGMPQDKDAASNEAKRTRILDRFLGQESTQQFADPSVLFGTR